jgi:hypothetical protein
MQKDPDFLYRQKQVWLDNQKNLRNFTLVERDKQKEGENEIAGSSVNVYQIYG